MIINLHPTSNETPPGRHWLAPVVGLCAYCAVEVGRRYRVDLSRPAVLCRRHVRRMVRRINFPR